MLRAHGLVDRQFAVATTDPRLFGAFVEHLGRCIYGGLFEPGHPDADEHGFRKDVLALVCGSSGRVCYITISKTGVKLGVANGRSLPDPHRLLQGSGKNVRHVPLSKVDDLEQTGLDDLAAHTVWRKRAG